jgi:large subunit ribosomal protein L7/L12
MPKLDDQISTLQERLTQLKLRQQRLDARKRAIDTLRERKAATRRRILVGGIVLAKVEQGEIDAEQFRGWLDRALTRTQDRALFDLPTSDRTPLPDLISAMPDDNV